MENAQRQENGSDEDRDQQKNKLTHQGGRNGRDVRHGAALALGGASHSDRGNGRDHLGTSQGSETKRNEPLAVQATKTTSKIDSQNPNR